MKYVEVMRYCLSLPNTKQEALNASGKAFALKVGNNVFGQFETGAPIAWQFKLRVTPEHYEELPNPPKVRQVKDMDDDNWLIIERVENFDDEFLKELIDWSYQRAQVVLADTA